MKNILILLFVLSSFALSAGGITGGIEDNIKSQVASFYATFQSSAQGLLYSLGVIQLVLTFGFMAMRGELELGGAAAQLVKTALIVGLFSMLIDSPAWFNGIYNGLNNMARSAGGIGTLEDILASLAKMWGGWWEYKFDITELGNSIALFLVLFIASVVIFAMIGAALTNYAFSVLSVYVGVFWLGFGSFEQTRPWAINAIANVLRNGLKWVMSMLIISIAISLINNLNSALFTSSGMEDIVLWFNFLGTVIIFYSVNSGIGSWVDSYFTGSGGGENSKGVQFVQSAMNAGAGAAAGAYMGMKGASDTIAAASARGESMSVGQKIGAYAKSMTSGASKGAIHGGESFASNWAKTVDPNYSMSSNTPTPQNPSAGFGKSPSSDGDVGGGTKGSVAEPKVGGEINPNQSDKS